MPATVRLQALVEALEMQFDEHLSFLDLDTGEVETVAADLLSLAEESSAQEPDILEWQKHEWETAKRIAATGRFLKLPSKHDVHEWVIMQEFADTVDSETTRRQLLQAIHGPGAFRWFKDVLRRHSIEPAWYAFRTETLRNIARRWCAEHNLVCK
jgi:hypothetical protein